MGLARYARRFGASTLEALFPPVCPGCHDEIGSARALCPTCWHDMVFLDGPGCRHCGRILAGADPALDQMICEECLRHPPEWQRGAAAFRYEGTGRKLVLGLKHGDRLDTVPMLGQWMQRAGRRVLGDADLIVPVPLHWTRHMKRRTNQAAELARWLSGQSPAHFAPGALMRARRTGTQDGKDRVARAANLDGAFRASAQVAGKRVLVIDDVLTTGATLNATTRVLIEAGARAVDILVLALVVRDRYAYLGETTKDEDPTDEDD